MPTRDEMVERQLARRGISDRRVLAAMRAVPREVFVPRHLQRHAYDDRPLPIGDDQTISQPLMVATMAELARLSPEDTALEIGAGCGYQAAVLAKLCKHVYGVEIRAALADKARDNLVRANIDNVTIVTGDGGYGLRQHAPFDAIVVSAAIPDVPPPLLDQLADGGHLIAPLGDRHNQELVCVTRMGHELVRTHHGLVRFVAFIGDFGAE